MQILRRSSLAFVAALTLAVVTLLPGDSAEAGAPFENIDFWGGAYLGVTNSGLPAVVAIDPVDHKALLAVLVLLNPPCTGAVVDVVLFNMDIGEDDGDFSGNTTTGGGGGQLLEAQIDAARIGPAGDAADVPYIFGSVTGHPPGNFDCVGSAVFYALPGGLMFGDVDCSLFDVFNPGGSAVSQAAVDLGSITSIDALKILRFVAGLGSAAGPIAGQGDGDPCPPIGEVLPNGKSHGDGDCDGDVDAVDALKILRAVVGLDGRVTPADPTPQPPELPPAPPPGFCPFIGDFWFPFFPDLLPGRQ